MTRSWRARPTALAAASTALSVTLAVLLIAIHAYSAPYETSA